MRKRRTGRLGLALFISLAYVVFGVGFGWIVYAATKMPPGPAAKIHGALAATTLIGGVTGIITAARKWRRS